MCSRRKLVSFGIITLVILGLSIAGCGPPPVEPTPIPEEVPAPAPVEPTPPPTPVPTPTPTPPTPVTESVWEVNVESVKTERSLSYPPSWRSWQPGTPLPESCSFYLFEREKTFLVVRLLLRSTAGGNTMGLQDIIVHHSELGDFHPVGLRVDGVDGLTAVYEVKYKHEESVMRIKTFRVRAGENWDFIFTDNGGTCVVHRLGDVVLFYINVSYIDGHYGMKNNCGMATITGTSAGVVTLDPFDLAYVVPSQCISSGQLWLELPYSQPVELEVVTK